MNPQNEYLSVDTVQALISQKDRVPGFFISDFESFTNTYWALVGGLSNTVTELYSLFMSLSVVLDA